MNITPYCSVFEGRTVLKNLCGINSAAYASFRASYLHNYQTIPELIGPAVCDVIQRQEHGHNVSNVLGLRVSIKKIFFHTIHSETVEKNCGGIAMQKGSL